METIIPVTDEEVEAMRQVVAGHSNNRGQARTTALSLAVDAYKYRLESGWDPGEVIIFAEKLYAFITKDD